MSKTYDAATKKLRYVSLFSGIEAASVAWEPLGWEPVAFSEIDKFPCAVLAERFPDVPNLGDITKVDWREYAGSVDVVVGGSPCQSFSIAGKREGLAGESGLMFEYIRAVRELMPKYFVWENVPGALSSEGGAAFGQLLSEVDDIGYGLAWRVLDAQFFGVPQRRRRVFLVGSFGDRRSADVLFEPESLRWDYPSSRDKRKGLATGAEKRAGSSYWQIAGNIINRQPQHGGHQLGIRNPEIEGAFTLTTADRHAVVTQKTMVVRCGCAGGGKGALIQDDVSATLATSNTQTLFQPVCMMGDHGKAAVDVGVSGTLTAHDAKGAPIVSECLNPWDNQTGRVVTDSGAYPTVRCNPAGGNNNASVLTRHIVRRLTPRECERLQGFPDNWTRIPYKGKSSEECPDTPRYKALGNSMAVPVMRWIGERIASVDSTRDGSDDGR